jgi:DNA-binding NarL/FixJ family response regulator
VANYRILIADDHEIVRKGLRSLLESQGWEVCGEAVDGWDAVHKAEELAPDLVALDIGMPNLNGLDAARQMLRNDARTKILFLTVHETEQAVKMAVQIGAKGLILKSDAGRELVEAVECVQRNSTYFSPRIAQHAMSLDSRGSRFSAYKDALTARERQVLQLVAEGKNNKAVASLLGLSVKTVETHRSNIMEKLNVHSVSELVLYAIRTNMVQTHNTVAPADTQNSEPTPVGSPTSDNP